MREGETAALTCAGTARPKAVESCLAPSEKFFDDVTRKSEARFRALFDSNLVGIAFWDSSRDFITEANDAYLSIIGYTRAEFESGKISWRDLTPAGDPDFDETAPRDVYSSAVRIYEKEYCRRDGTRTPIVFGLAAPSDGRLEGLAFALDIREGRLDPHLLRSQKLESLSVLAGGIAHDFNNLLMGIIANVTLMMDDLPPDSPLEGLGENILAATEQAAHLTRQMLAFSGGGRVTLRPVELTKEVDGISTKIRSSIKKGIRLRFNLDPNLPRIHADAAQIHQLVMNLVQNADEAIETAGTVTISASVREVRPQNARVTLVVARLPPGRYALLEVSDSGIGMDEQTQAKIFDPFFTTRFIGRGLGLAAVAGIVRGHNGGIGVSSEPGKGSSFQVFFPLEQVMQSASG